MTDTDTVKLGEICAELDRLIPPALAESYDNPGLIVGNPQEIVTGVICCLDATREVVQEAVDTNCNLIVAHHPIVFSGLKSLTGKNYIEQSILHAIRNNIGIYAAHTNLDNLFDGVNHKLAARLGLIRPTVLQPKSDTLVKLVTFVPTTHLETVRSALFGAGGGHIGNYDQCSFSSEGGGTFRGSADTKPFTGKAGSLHTEPENRLEVIVPLHLVSEVCLALKKAHPYEEVAYDVYPLRNKHPQIGAGLVAELDPALNETEFLRLIADRLNCGCIRHTPLLNRPVKRVALCGGSGSFLLTAAMRAGADVFLSADFKYHQFFDAENSILIADVGHFESEQFTIELLRDIILKKFNNFAVRLTRVNTNPIRYFS